MLESKWLYQGCPPQGLKPGPVGGHGPPSSTTSPVSSSVPELSSLKREKRATFSFWLLLFFSWDS